MSSRDRSRDPAAAFERPDAQPDLLQAVELYADAKCGHDPAAALARCHERFVLNVPTRSLTVEDEVAVKRQLRAFFTTFPDDRAHIEGRFVGRDAVVFWCEEVGTMEGPSLGLSVDSIITARAGT